MTPVVRLGVLEDEFHWHKHDHEGEFFLVLDGELVIEVEGHDTVKLGPQQGFTMPKGIMHETSAPTRTVVVMIEPAGVVPTGATDRLGTPPSSTVDGSLPARTRTGSSEVPSRRRWVSSPKRRQAVRQPEDESAGSSAVGVRRAEPTPGCHLDGRRKAVARLESDATLAKLALRSVVALSYFCCSNHQETGVRAASRHHIRLSLARVGPARPSPRTLSCDYSHVRSSQTSMLTGLLIADNSRIPYSILLEARRVVAVDPHVGPLLADLSESETHELNFATEIARDDMAQSVEPELGALAERVAEYGRVIRARATESDPAFADLVDRLNARQDELFKMQAAKQVEVEEARARSRLLRVGVDNESVQSNKKWLMPAPRLNRPASMREAAASDLAAKVKQAADLITARKRVELELVYVWDGVGERYAALHDVAVAKSAALEARNLAVDAVAAKALLQVYVSWFADRAAASGEPAQAASAASEFTAVTALGSPEHHAISKTFDAFISHASEDKDSVVRPLAQALSDRGLSVWLDAQELTVGDSLSRKIDAGLNCSRFGVVVLSGHDLITVAIDGGDPRGTTPSAHELRQSLSRERLAGISFSKSGPRGNWTL